MVERHALEAGRIQACRSLVITKIVITKKLRMTVAKMTSLTTSV
ncbi:MAG TPA: hypothetical protein VKA40_05335 [Nitrososphaera sp.]|nr:hypothetical protein [Nitrososphaera sp.]